MYTFTFPPPFMEFSSFKDVTHVTHNDSADFVYVSSVRSRGCGEY